MDQQWISCSIQYIGMIILWWWRSGWLLELLYRQQCKLHWAGNQAPSQCVSISSSKSIPVIRARVGHSNQHLLNNKKVIIINTRTSWSSWALHESCFESSKHWIFIDLLRFVAHTMILLVIHHFRNPNIIQGRWSDQNISWYVFIIHHSERVQEAAMQN